jgi:hypothetical protein
MSTIPLPGLNGSNPLAFMAAVGLLRVLSRESRQTRLGFVDDGSFTAFVGGFDGDIVAAVARDAQQSTGNQPWNLSYEKHEKKGTKTVADLKAPPDAFAGFLHESTAQWRKGRGEGAEYAAAYGTSVARDGNDNTKPTAFHFTAANQEFLKAVEASRARVDAQWVLQSLMRGHASRPGSNLRWDPAAERSWALMANNPTSEGTSVDAPLEWLAFRGLPLFPTFPRDANPRPRIITTAVSGRGDEMKLTWPLWCVPASPATVRSLLQLRWSRSLDNRARGVFSICHSEVRRTSQGFGNFGPATVET